jgi:PAS domain S-box-containing protein
MLIYTDLSPDARIQFCSDSIEDILGYLPHEVKGKSCWDYFHQDEVVFAKQIHQRGVELDKAAVLNYCRIKHQDGTWIGCECVFTVVHDVLVASTAVYHCGPKANRKFILKPDPGSLLSLRKGRAIEGANVRRIFSSSPRDPRYHMLSYLSSKFYQEPMPHTREPRAALFLNRFTRTSTIMFATAGVSQILGIEPDQLSQKSFYYCIEEACLGEAVKCIESAKSNDSIAYLRFRYRNPLQSLSRAHSVVMEDDESDEDDDGGVRIRESERSSVEMRDPTPQPGGVSLQQTGSSRNVPLVNGTGPTHGAQHTRTLSDRMANEPAVMRHRMLDLDRAIEERVISRQHPEDPNRLHPSSSENSIDHDRTPDDQIFDPPEVRRSSSQTSPDRGEGLEVEAVISCTSDGLVVVLRKAHPLVPPSLEGTESSYFPNGLFASPWAPQPVLPEAVRQASTAPGVGFPATSEPAEAGFMAAIRDVAVFAWSLTGINGSLAQYGVGLPTGEAVPPGGLPVWDPNDPNGKANDIYNGFSGSRHRPLQGMGDPVVLKTEDSSSSDDEILWRREPTMSAWRRPKRRAEDRLDGDETGGRKKRVSKERGGTSSSTD